MGAGTKRGAGAPQRPGQSVPDDPLAWSRPWAAAVTRTVAIPQFPVKDRKQNKLPFDKTRNGGPETTVVKVRPVSGNQGRLAGNEISTDAR